MHFAAGGHRPGLLPRFEFILSLSVPWPHVEVTGDLLRAYGVDKGVGIDLLDLGDDLPGVGCTDDGVDDLFIPVGKRAFSVDESGSVAAGGVDHGADSVGHVGYDKKSPLLIVPVKAVKSLG